MEDNRISTGVKLLLLAVASEIWKDRTMSLGIDYAIGLIARGDPTATAEAKMLLDANSDRHENFDWSFDESIKCVTALHKNGYGLSFQDGGVSIIAPTR